MMEGAVFFRSDQMEEMAYFISALRANGDRFRSETDQHGFYIIIL